VQSTARKINLVAVQASPELADYVSAHAFHTKMAALAQQAVAAVDRRHPTLLAFPEAIGLFLTFVPFHYDDIKDCRTFRQALLKVLSRRLPSFLEAMWRHRMPSLRRVVFLDTALAAEKIYADTFASLAREHGVYLLAGSLYTPPIEEEAVKGRHLLSTYVYNTSYLFSPQGVILRRIPKANLVEPLETAAGFGRGSKSELCPVETALGRIGVLICYDAFHHTLVEHYDALGTDILVQPSYNNDLWDGPWSGGRGLTEGQAWLRFGLPSIIQGRENIRYGVNPMMVGRIFDLVGQGRSSISINTGRPGASLEDALLAIAAIPDGEEIVAATVDAPDGIRPPAVV
jgi:predicted amidohydrolase